jgi:DNA repair exonuclease SbcCD ATPase subunit
VWQVAKLTQIADETRQAFEKAEKEEADRRKELDQCEVEMKKLAKARDAAKKVRHDGGQGGRWLRVQRRGHAARGWGGGNTCPTTTPVPFSMLSPSHQARTPPAPNPPLALSQLQQPYLS